LAGISEEALRSIIREELKVQISPVTRSLAEAREGNTPGLREIVGGLGWVAGAGGLVLWLKRRPRPAIERTR
jgi:nickel transport protein